MQTSRLFDFPTVHSSFKRHRSSIDHPRFPLNLTLCKPTTSPVWGSLPTPPMSGSPPPELPRDPSQLAGRRRKRSNTPVGTATGSVNTVPSLVEHTPHPYGESSIGLRRDEPSMQVATQPFPPYLPSLTHGAGGGIPVGQYPGPEISGLPPQISPRSTRKTKAHVASACVNCKKKHLRCDSSRPCRRCIQGGKEDSCHDVEHKKRGRPPLKPEDPSSAGRARGHTSTLSASMTESSNTTFSSEHRGFTSYNYPPILPNAQSPSYTYGSANNPRLPTRYGSLSSPYAQPTIAPNPLTAAGTFTYPRPPNSSSAFSGQIPPVYTTSTLPISQEQYPRQTPPYMAGSGNPYPGFRNDPLPTHQPYYQTPTYPGDQPPLRPQSESQIGPYRNITVQLPPILPTAYEPTFAPQSQQTMIQQQPPQQGLQAASSARSSSDGREPDPKRPRMDIQGILGPKQD